MPKKLVIPEFKTKLRVNAENPKKETHQIGILDKKKHVIKFADGTEVEVSKAKDVTIYEE